MRLLTITLDLPLHPGDIPAFRGAILERIDPKAELFHGHANDPEAADPFHRGFPLVQYAVRKGRATLIGIERGAEELLARVLPNLKGALTYGGQTRCIEGYRLDDREIQLEQLDSPRGFGLAGWVALNRKNYQMWKTCQTAPDRLRILDRALTGHLRAFAERAALPDHKSIEAQVVDIDNQKRIHWHGAKWIRFHVKARANLNVPYGIGIGRSASFGFGEVMAPEAYLRFTRASRRRPEVL